MDPNTQVSVVIPAYNSANCIQATLASVAAQTIQPKEIIVVDDGSSDNTCDAVEAFSTANPHLQIRLLREQHRGPGAARNIGVEAASGPWIAFLDSDDLWDPSKLERVADASQKFPEANFLCHNEIHRRLDGSTIVLDHSKGYRADRGLPEQLYVSNHFSPSAVVCRRDIVLACGGFDTTLASGQDYELWLRISPGLKVIFVTEVLGAYVDRYENISSGKAWRRFKNLSYILHRHRDKVDGFTYSITLTRRFISFIYNTLKGCLKPSEAAIISKAHAEHINYLYFPTEGSGDWNFDKFVNNRPLRYFSYGRHALFEALKVIGCTKGDSVLLPAFVCRELLSAISATGAAPVYYSVDERLFLAEQPEKLPPAKAILAVNYFGFPQNLAPFQQYAKKTGAVVIEDNAHGFLSRDEEGRALGTRGDIGIFSLRKTLLLPNGAAMVMNTPVNTRPLELQKISKAAAPLSFIVKRFLRKKAPMMNLKMIRMLTSIARTMRKATTGYEILPSDSDAERLLPVDSAPCQSLMPTLRRLDEANEISRRRELYTVVDSLIRNAGYKPVFSLLPQGVAPYAYPFYSSEHRIDHAKRILKQVGLECITWPELPDEIRPGAPEHYRTVWMINFL